MESMSNYPYGKVSVLSPTYRSTKNHSFLFNHLYGLLVLISLFLFWNINARATHVVGGGITYTQMENNNYLLTVKLYRDCSPGTAQLPGNVNVKCRRGNDGSNPGTYGSLVLPLTSVTQLQPAIPACAFDPGICVEEAIYEAIVNIPPGPGGYHLYFTICCRNGTIANIQNPLGAQETFYAYIPDNTTLQSQMNSSPFFTDIPPVYVCAGQPLDLSFSALDIDGDSLDYYFYTPYDGQNNGGITYGVGNPPNNINISTVNWQAGFGAADPLDPAPGVLPGLSIDNNGFISGVPTAPGQYVVGVMIDEYRDGVLIGRISRDFQFNVINCPPPLQAGIGVANNCNGLAVDFLNTSTGVITDQWWSFGTGNLADTTHAVQPSFTYASAGTYTVTLIVQPGTECADTISYQLSVMDAVAFNVGVDSVSCNGLSDGQAVASSNDPNYSYNWSTQQTGNAIQNLAPGNYWAEAINTIGCSDTQFFAVTEPTVLQVQFNPTPPLCNGDQNGYIEAIGSGGTGPYTYFWPAQNFYGPIFQNLGFGNYSIEVTDANGCFIWAQQYLTQPTPVNAVVIMNNPVSCHGLNDGSVAVDIFGGVPGYSIDWITLPNDSTYMNNLAAGTYIAEVTDANNCLAIVNAYITEPDTFFVDVVVIGDETCSGANGSAFADITGGVGVIDYVWTPGGQTTDFISGLSAGPIQVTVQDENGCTDIANGVIIDHPAGIATAGVTTPVSCQNGSDGSFQVIMSGGSAPFNYSWSCACPNQNTATGLTAGNYWVAVMDNYGCSDTLDFVINELPPLQVQSTTFVGPSCNGYSDGQLGAQAIGGTQPYAYAWNSVPAQNAALATGLPAGTFTLTVTDVNGCQETMSAQLVDPPVLIADIQVMGNNICFGDSAGVAVGQGIGGTSPYTYLWVETGGTNAVANNLPAGPYQLEVTDFNGCKAFNHVEIIEYDSVYAEITFNDGFCPGDNVDFYVQTNGLNNQYNYYWFVDHVLESTSNTFSYPITDTSSVGIILVNLGNCPMVVDSVEVGPILMKSNNVKAFSTPDTICYGSNAVIHATIDDTSYVNSIKWNDLNLIGLGPHTVSPVIHTDYIITIENICGEQQSDTARVNVFLPPTAEIFADGLSGCDEITVDFGYEYDDNYAYSFEGAYWNILNEQYNELTPSVSYSHSAAVSTSLYIAFSNGCIFRYDTVLVTTVYTSPDADFYVNPDPALENEVTEFIDVSYGDTKNWEWYVEGQFVSSDERPSYVFDQQGEYTITQIVFDENGCSDTMEHQIEVIGTYTVYVPNAFTPDGNGLNNTFKPIVDNVDPDQYTFMIFNRWGEKVYETQVIDNAWDGTYLGETVRDGVYIWKVLVTDNVGIEHEYVGHVTLLR